VPRHGEVVLSLTRLNQLGPVDQEASQVTAGAGVTLQQVVDAGPGLDLGILIASRDSATVGGAVATNAGGLRVLRFGPMRGSISAEHGIGALKAPWLALARTDAERALFARIRSALDPSATLNPNVL
jgi:FAD/FMN-containing dehydrogenase